MTRQKYTRRDVLKVGGAAFAAPVLVPGRVLGLDGTTPPSETLNVALVGCGIRGTALAGSYAALGGTLQAVCDSDPVAQAAGGAVDNGNTHRTYDWALYFCEYGSYMPPVVSGPVGALSGINVEP